MEKVTFATFEAAKKEFLRGKKYELDCIMEPDGEINVEEKVWTRIDGLKFFERVEEKFREPEVIFYWTSDGSIPKTMVDLSIESVLPDENIPLNTLEISMLTAYAILSARADKMFSLFLRARSEGTENAAKMLHVEYEYLLEKRDICRKALERILGKPYICFKQDIYKLIKRVKETEIYAR